VQVLNQALPLSPMLHIPKTEDEERRQLTGHLQRQPPLPTFPNELPELTRVARVAGD
jgi:hypothetical protein